MKLLLIEDNDDVAAATADLLRFAGHEVLRADDDETALSLLRRHEVSLVLLDWGLPGQLWGRPLIRELRSIVGTRLPLLVYSADCDARTDAAAESIESFLAKPFSVDDLLGSVRRCAK